MVFFSLVYAPFDRGICKTVYTELDLLVSHSPYPNLPGTRLNKHYKYVCVPNVIFAIRRIAAVIIAVLKFNQSPRLIRPTLKASIIGAFHYRARELNTSELRDRRTFYNNPFMMTMVRGWKSATVQQCGLYAPTSILYTNAGGPKTSTVRYLFIRAVFARTRAIFRLSLDPSTKTSCI